MNLSDLSDDQRGRFLHISYSLWSLYKHGDLGVGDHRTADAMDELLDQADIEVLDNLFAEAEQHMRNLPSEQHGPELATQLSAEEYKTRRQALVDGEADDAETLSEQYPLSVLRHASVDPEESPALDAPVEALQQAARTVLRRDVEKHSGAAD